MRLETCGDPNARRIEAGGDLIGFAVKLSNGRWGAYDTRERPLTKRTFANPKTVLRWFKDMNPDAT